MPKDRQRDDAPDDAGRTRKSLQKITAAQLKALRAETTDDVVVTAIRLIKAANTGPSPIRAPLPVRKALGDLRQAVHNYTDLYGDPDN